MPTPGKVITIGPLPELEGKKGYDCQTIWKIPGMMELFAEVFDMSVERAVISWNLDFPSPEDFPRVTTTCFPWREALRRLPKELVHYEPHSEFRPTTESTVCQQPPDPHYRQD